MPVRRLMLGLAAVVILVLSGCGDDDDTTADDDTVAGDDDAADDDAGAGDDASADDDAGDPASEAEDLAEDVAEGLENLQAAQGGGSATLVAGDQEWSFDSVLCAFGPEEIGQEGAEFVLSSIQEGLQMYASIDSFGHSLSLDDIEDFENPSVSLSTFGLGDDDFIVVDGKNVTAETDFVDNTSDSLERVAGTFTATCP